MRSSLAKAFKPASGKEIIVRTLSGIKFEDWSAFNVDKSGLCICYQKVLSILAPLALLLTEKELTATKQKASEQICQLAKAEFFVGRF